VPTHVSTVQEIEVIQVKSTNSVKSSNQLPEKISFIFVHLFCNYVLEPVH